MDVRTMSDGSLRFLFVFNAEHRDAALREICARAYPPRG